jgi:hypothetical protein
MKKRRNGGIRPVSDADVPTNEWQPTIRSPTMSALPMSPEWPQPLRAYEHLRTATMADWAWEYLRRNPAYQAEARLYPRRGVVRRLLATGTIFTRMRSRHARAEAWGLCSFR